MLLINVLFLPKPYVDHTANLMHMLLVIISSVVKLLRPFLILSFFLCFHDQNHVHAPSLFFLHSGGQQRIYLLPTLFCLHLRIIKIFHSPPINFYAGSQHTLSVHQIKTSHVYDCPSNYPCQVRYELKNDVHKNAYKRRIKYSRA